MPVLADEGRATDWHVVHLGHLALSGAALLTIEATAVLPEARISARDLGLWSDDTERALARVLETVRRGPDIRIAIQLAHAGRKASARVPWEGGTQIPPHQPGGWQTVAPSPLPFAASDHPPLALDAGGMARVRDACAAAARRAARLGLDAIQIHCAHGYRLQVPLARAVNCATRMPVVAVGLITEFEQAEAIVANGDADFVALARAMLYNPRWPWHAAAHFGATLEVPNQCLRSQPLRYRELFKPPARQT